MTSSPSVLRSGGRIDVGFLAILAALVILPLYPKVGLIAVSGTYIPIRLDDFVTLAVIGAWVATLVRERRMPRVPPIWPPVVLWLGLGLVALAIGAAALNTVSWGTGALFWAKPIEYLALGWAAYDLIDRPGRLRLVLSAVFVAASIVVAYAIFERFGWLPHAPNYATDVTSRRVLGSTMGDSHQMATYLGIVVLVGIAAWHLAPRLARNAAFLGFGLTAYVLVHAAGRSEFLSLAVCTGMLAIWRPTRLPAVVMLAILAVAFVLPTGIEEGLDQALGRHAPPPAAVASPDLTPGGSASPSASAPPPISVSERFDKLEADRSLQIRMERWPVFFAIWLRDPIFGGGPSAATEAADGYYVRSLTEVGIAGTIAFAVMLLAVLLALRRTFQRGTGIVRAAAIGLVAGTFFISLVGVLIDSWVASRVMQLYWPLVGATLGAVASVRAVPERSTIQPDMGTLAEPMRVD
jgi:hypothetical protein